MKKRNKIKSQIQCSTLHKDLDYSILRPGWIFFCFYLHLRVTGKS